MKKRFARSVLRAETLKETVSQCHSLMFWVINLLFPHQAYIQSSLKCFLYILMMSLLKVKKLQNLRLTVHSLPVEFLQRTVLKVDPNRKLVDLNRVVVVTETLALNYALKNFQWVFLYTSNCNQKFPCQILVLPPELTPSHSQFERNKVVFMTPVALFNLRTTTNSSRLVDMTDVRLVPTTTCDEPQRSVPFGLSRIPARVVRLARVTSPEAGAAGSIEKLLKNYFEQSRLLNVGDLVVIQGSEDQEIFLKVVNIEGEGLIEPNTSVIYSASVVTTSVFLHDKEVHSFKPISEEYFVSGDGVGRIVPTCCPSIRPCVRSVCDWIDRFSHFSSTKSNRDDDSSELWPTVLLTGPVGSGKYTICREASRREGMNLYVMNVANLVGDTSAFTIAKLMSGVAQRAKSLAPCIVVLKNVHFLGKDKDGEEDKRVILAFIELLNEFNRCRKTEIDSVFFIGITHSPDEVAPLLKDCFIHKVAIEPLKAEAEILEYFLWKNQQEPRMKFEFDVPTWLSNSGAKNVLKYFGDLKAFEAIAKREAQIGVLRSTGGTCEDVPLGFIPTSEFSGRPLVVERSHFEKAFAQLELDVRSSVGSPKVPVVSWNDIGGLPDVKKELISSVQLPLKFPHLFTSGLKRSGILLYGPPGTGKTLLAKAVASEFKISFLSVKGPELLNMYVGQSEQNVRDVFQRARESSPCVLFFDELDSLAPNRGKSGDSGGVMDRVVSQILAELDGTHSTPNVFIIGATNRPDLIDPALLRPGRFDKLVYVGVSTDSSAAGSILKALTRKFRMDDDVNLDAIADKLPEGMSGADLSALCSGAFMAAITRKIDLMEQGECNLESPVTVSQLDFLAALASVKPSLTTEELNKYQELKSFVR